MADLSNFAWAVLETVAVKERCNDPVKTHRCDQDVMAALLRAGAVEKRAVGKPSPRFGQRSALYMTETGTKLLAEHKAQQRAAAESP